MSMVAERIVGRVYREAQQLIIVCAWTAHDLHAPVRLRVIARVILLTKKTSRSYSVG